MATSTRSIKTRTPALIPAIFTTRSVCLAGSGMTSGSSVAPMNNKDETTIITENETIKAKMQHPSRTCLFSYVGICISIERWRDKQQKKGNLKL